MSASSPVFGSPRQAAALLVGIDAYQPRNRIPALQFAAHDAQSLADILKDPNLCAFPPEKVKVLTDRRATYGRVFRYLSHWLPRQARDAEVVFIYFAGHGTVELAGAQEEGYLLPYDANPDSLMTSAIRMSDLTRLVNPDHLGARALIVCLDCCHAARIIPRGGALRGEERDLVLYPSALGGMVGRGRFILASCSAGQKSLEVNDLQHGLFTHHLIEGLRGAGDQNADGKVSVAELFSYVSTAVSEEARSKHQHEQSPWAGQSYSEDVVLSMPRRNEPRPDGVGPPDDQTPIQEGHDPAELPALFRSLAHPQEVVRQRAQKAIQDFGWKEAAFAIVERAGQMPAEEVGWILDGLNAFEANPNTVSLLNQLEAVLHGDLRRQAAELYDRKRLGLGRKPLAEVFQRVQSPYQIEKVLGTGMYTAAYLASKKTTDHDDRSLVHEVVVRVLRPEYADRPAVRSRFLDLSHRAEQFVHHNLVLTREVRSFPEHKLFYTVRDYVPGATLRDRLENGRPFAPLEIVFLIQAVLEGLTPLHEARMAHRGIKPSNLFLSTQDRLKVGDPSLPVVLDDWNYKRVAYDFRYTAPECFDPAATPGPAADLYSLACVVHELLRGNPPFVSDNPYELPEQHRRNVVGPGDRSDRVNLLFDDWLQLLLVKAPVERDANLDPAREKVDEIKALLRPAKAKPAGTFASIDLLDEASLAAVNTGQSVVQFVLPPAPDEFLKQLETTATSPPQPAASQPPGEVQAPAEPDRPRQVEPIPVPQPAERADSSENPALAEALDEWGDSLPAISIDSPEGEPPAKEADEWVSLDAPSGAAQGEGDLFATLAATSAERPFIPPSLPDYEIQGELGRGGNGVVYKAWHLKLGRLVALKMMHNALLDTELARFRTEAVAIARLNHPNIVQVYEINECRLSADGPPSPYFSLEFCPGGSLEARLKSNPPAPTAAAQLIKILARAIHAAHEHGMIHRDLKPGNVLLMDDGTPKITDFGLAKRLDKEESKTLTGQLLGTPSYMAPEQASSNGQLGPFTDVYALGAILYECLTGRPPFRAATLFETIYQVVNDDPIPPSRLAPLTPRDLETITLKCLRKEPARRYESAQALADDLSRFLNREPISTRPVGFLERTRKWARRRPVVAGLSAALIAVVVIAFLAISIGYWVALGALAREQQANRERARAEVESLLDVAPPIVPSILERLTRDAAVREAARQRLEELWEELAPSSDPGPPGVDGEETNRRRDRRLRVGLGLLSFEPDRVKWALLDWMLQTEDPAERLLIRDQLAPHANELIGNLRERLEGTQGPARQRMLQAVRELEETRPGN
jgi:serine/threonine protein kinase